MVPQIMKKMIADSEGSLHDIEHFIKVWTYARTIGELEGLDAETQFRLEISAIIHDIACPSLRVQYGYAPGKLQESEGMSMARDFLAQFALTPEQIDRICFLVGHHHTPAEADGPDYRILLEADYLVNASESNYSKDNILRARETIFRTQTGRELLTSIYILPSRGESST